VCLEFIGVASLAGRSVDICDGLWCGDFVVDDLLGDAFKVDQHLHYVLGDDGQVLENGQKHIQNLIGGAGVFDGERVQRADGRGQLNGDFLNRVDHFLVLLNDLGNVIDRAVNLSENFTYETAPAFETTVPLFTVAFKGVGIKTSPENEFKFT
jgi:hypothetical protein